MQVDVLLWMLTRLSPREANLHGNVKISRWCFRSTHPEVASPTLLNIETCSGSFSIQADNEAHPAVRHINFNRPPSDWKRDLQNELMSKGKPKDGYLFNRWAPIHSDTESPLQEHTHRHTLLVIRILHVCSLCCLWKVHAIKNEFAVKCTRCFKGF